MKLEKDEHTLEGCNCINCRLARMEATIQNMQESVSVIIDNGTAIPGMPKENNKMKKK
jgi:hypothetical protein